MEMCEADLTTTLDLDETVVYSESDTDTDSDATFVYDVSSDCGDDEGNEENGNNA